MKSIIARKFFVGLFIGIVTFFLMQIMAFYLLTQDAQREVIRSLPKVLSIFIGNIVVFSIVVSILSIAFLTMMFGSDHRLIRNIASEVRLTGESGSFLTFDKITGNMTVNIVVKNDKKKKYKFIETETENHYEVKIL